MENILEISKLNKSYTDFSLTDVSFSLPDNSITGFIGVNGSGKTTYEEFSMSEMKGTVSPVYKN